jgi:hypothetical protein
MHYSWFLFPMNTPVINEMIYTYHTGSYKIIQKWFNQTPMTSHNYNQQENATSGAFIVLLSTFCEQSQKKKILHTIGFLHILLTNQQLIKTLHRLVNHSSCSTLSSASVHTS